MLLRSFVVLNAGLNFRDWIQGQLESRSQALAGDGPLEASVAASDEVPTRKTGLLSPHHPRAGSIANLTLCQAAIDSSHRPRVTTGISGISPPESAYISLVASHATTASPYNSHSVKSLLSDRVEERLIRPAWVSQHFFAGSARNTQRSSRP